MPTELTVQTKLSNFTYTAPDVNGNTFDNSTGDVFLAVKSTSTGTHAVTVAEHRTCNFGHSQGYEVNYIYAGETRIFGPFDILRFNNASREVSVTYTTVVGIQVAAVRAIAT